VKLQSAIHRDACLYKNETGVPHPSYKLASWENWPRPRRCSERRPTDICGLKIQIRMRSEQDGSLSESPPSPSWRLTSVLSLSFCLRVLRTLVRSVERMSCASLCPLRHCFLVVLPMPPRHSRTTHSRKALGRLVQDGKSYMSDIDQGDPSTHLSRSPWLPRLVDVVCSCGDKPQETTQCPNVDHGCHLYRHPYCNSSRPSQTSPSVPQIRVDDTHSRLAQRRTGGHDTIPHHLPLDVPPRPIFSAPPHSNVADLRTPITPAF
jgi:hypothetical protein